MKIKKISKLLTKMRNGQVNSENYGGGGGRLNFSLPLYVVNKKRFIPDVKNSVDLGRESDISASLVHRHFEV